MTRTNPRYESDSIEEERELISETDLGYRCEHCDGRFDANATVTVLIPSTTLYQCPACGRWTEGPEHR